MMRIKTFKKIWQYWNRHDSIRFFFFFSLFLFFLSFLFFFLSSYFYSLFISFFIFSTFFSLFFLEFFSSVWSQELWCGACGAISYANVTVPFPLSYIWYLRRVPRVSPGSSHSPSPFLLSFSLSVFLYTSLSITVYSLQGSRKWSRPSSTVLLPSSAHPPSFLSLSSSFPTSRHC